MIISVEYQGLTYKTIATFLHQNLAFANASCNS